MNQGKLKPLKLKPLKLKPLKLKPMYVICHLNVILMYFFHCTLQSLYTITHVYSVYIVNGTMYCLGCVSSTGTVQALPVTMIKNQVIIQAYIKNNSGIIPNIQCEAVTTVQRVNCV